MISSMKKMKLDERLHVRSRGSVNILFPPLGRKACLSAAYLHPVRKTWHKQEAREDCTCLPSEKTNPLPCGVGHIYQKPWDCCLVIRKGIQACFVQLFRCTCDFSMQQT
ncbi:hypothetical protein Ancab_035947 [Ancistrocladus abbreviatus]